MKTERSRNVVVNSVSQDIRRISHGFNHAFEAPRLPTLRPPGAAGVQGDHDATAADRLHVVLFSLAWLVLIDSATAEDWPQFRGPRGLGIAADKKLPDAWDAKTNIAWKAELPGPGASSPIVAGGEARALSDAKTENQTSKDGELIHGVASIHLEFLPKQ
jgi:hypothetical protein